VAVTIERDLERLGRADLDLEELPLAPPMDADQPVELVPQPPRRRGRQPGSKNRPKLALVPDRADLIRQRAARLPSAKTFTGAAPKCESATADDVAASDDNRPIPAPIIPEIIPAAGDRDIKPPYMAPEQDGEEAGPPAPPPRPRRPAQEPRRRRHPGPADQAVERLGRLTAPELLERLTRALRILTED
jgi:hypothetical protein